MFPLVALAAVVQLVPHVLTASVCPANGGSHCDRSSSAVAPILLQTRRDHNTRNTKEVTTDDIDEDEVGSCCLSRHFGGTGTCGDCRKLPWLSNWCGKNKIRCERVCRATWCAKNGKKQIVTDANAVKSEDKHCCLSAKDETDVCGTCRISSWALPQSWCGNSKKQCEECSSERAVWCEATTNPTPVDPTPSAEPQPDLIDEPVVQVDGGIGHNCCFESRDTTNPCGTCYRDAWARANSFCSESVANCVDCSPGRSTWCPVVEVPAPTTTTTEALQQSPANTEATTTTTPQQPPASTKTTTTATIDTESPGSVTDQPRCCKASENQQNKCGTCYSHEWVPVTTWCGKSKANCAKCSGAWCRGGVDVRAGTTESSTTTEPATTTTAETTAADTTAVRQTTRESTTTAVLDSNSSWVTGTYTTGYWDCCKPSCSWLGKGSVNRPVATCDATTHQKLIGFDDKSVCDGGLAAACKDNQPFVYSNTLSMGFAAAAVSGSHGLVGDQNCGQCYELKFIDKRHTNGNWGGSHPKLVGKSMIIQVTNIGHDVNGEHSFDLQIPGAGQGAFDNGCTEQFPGYVSTDFDCDNNYGGCHHKDGCSHLPRDLQPGCEWRYDWYQWLMDGGQSNNPYIDFHRVQCPTELTDITKSIPTDDHLYPAVDLSKYP